LFIAGDDEFVGQKNLIIPMPNDITLCTSIDKSTMTQSKRNSHLNICNINLSTLRVNIIIQPNMWVEEEEEVIRKVAALVFVRERKGKNPEKETTKINAVRF
jgi:hypothetical protein